MAKRTTENNQRRRELVSATGDVDLERLLKAADAGGQGIDLSEMSDEEVIRRLSGH